MIVDHFIQMAFYSEAFATGFCIDLILVYV